MRIINGEKLNFIGVHPYQRPRRPVLVGVRREQEATALRHTASDQLTPIMLDVTNTDSIQTFSAAGHLTLRPCP